MGRDVVDLNSVESILYVIAASFCVGLIVTLVFGGLKYWIQWMDDRMNRGGPDDTDH